MDEIACFKRSFPILQGFYETWICRIEQRCLGHNHRQAAYYVWARYSMSMSTINALLDPKLIPDLTVICRGCLEFDVTLEAVSKFSELANAYLDFEKSAKAEYLRLLGKQGEIERLLKRRQQFQERFSDEPEGVRGTSWCHKEGGITGLMNRLDRQQDRRLYSILSHFAHGSVVALQMLDGGIEDPEKYLAQSVASTFTRYLESSRAFLDFIWQPVITPEGERCKHDFNAVMSANLP